MPPARKRKSIDSARFFTYTISAGGSLPNAGLNDTCFFMPARYLFPEYRF